MLAKSETRTIGEHTYKVTQMPAGKARKLFLRLLKTIGPAFSSLAASEAQEDEDGKLSSLGDAIVRLCADMSESDMDAIFEAVFNGGFVALVDDTREKPLTLQNCDLHFMGRLFDQLRVLAFALEVNYQDFLGALGAAR